LEVGTSTEWLEKVFRVGQDPQRVLVPILMIMMMMMMTIIIIIIMIIIIIIIIFMLNTNALTALMNVYSFSIILTPSKFEDLSITNNVSLLQGES
jgi:amino acid transporter